MNYEIVYLKEKTVAGITIRTSNSDPCMSKIIGEAWQRFWENDIYESISNKENNNSIGLYTNYENEVNGEYDLMVCCEIYKKENIPDCINVKEIEEGKYAKFVVKGNPQKVVAEFWNELWLMKLDRKYSFDFEEYKGDYKNDDAEVDIYISIN